ncbi:hypothetical protein [Patulibacter defluvii]|uniref:hypothetical protein n=1 Tax=Patulibacter defluvii TaxID=3095358 RepID=UPI002A74B7E0|nr:hypothetical protein [Patulibacter sp. DM4]
MIRRTTTTARAAAIALVALAAGLAAAPAGAAVPGDAPAGALPFTAVTAENGPVADLQRVVELAGTGPDAGVPRCLGPTSFERTAWLTVPPAATVRRISIEAAPRDAATAVPDLAVFVQPAGGGGDVHEPSACSGRETAGDGSRGDEAAGIRLVLAAGRGALVQVGWRGGDAAVPVVATLSATPLAAAPAPAGQAFADAPSIARGQGVLVPLRGATLAAGDPAQPRCPSEAGLWRRVRLTKRGSYALATAGGTASTITAYRGTPTGDSALDCADDGSGAVIGTTVRVTRATTLWLRVGTDRPEAPGAAGLAIQGPYPSGKRARAALPAVHDRALRVVDPQAPCTDARAPQPELTAASLRGLARGGRRLRGTSEGAACVGGRPTASRVAVAVARISGKRCAWWRGSGFGRPTSCSRPQGLRAARGLERWRIDLRRALAPGARYRVVAVGQVRRGGKLRTTKARTTATVRRGSAR